MMRKTWLDTQRLREEIAMTAARLIAEDGLDYASAKRKAARQITGEDKISGDLLPNNEQIEEEIRAYLNLFQADTHPAQLRELRLTALALMEQLSNYRLYLVGAVLNGTATSHSDIHLQAFCDNGKDLAIELLNRGVQYEVSETRHFAGRGMVETLSFLWRQHREQPPVGVHIVLYTLGDLRNAAKLDAQKRPLRLDAAGLRSLLHDQLTAV